MNDLYNTLLDIARTAVEHDPTLLNEIPRHPDEDAEYDEHAKEQEKQEWWFQQDEDEDWIRSHDFAEYQGEDR